MADKIPAENHVKDNLLSRMVINVIGIPAILFLIHAGGIFFTTFIGVVAIIGLTEFYSMLREREIQAMLFPGIICGITWIYCVYLAPEYLSFLLVLIILVMITLALFKGIENAVQKLSITLFGFFYIPFLLSALILLRALPVHLELIDREGARLVTMIFVTVWISDSAAYLFGKWLGRRKIAPRLSPKKTVVGSAAGFAGSLACVYLYYQCGLAAEFLSPANLIVIGFILGIFSQVGDFTESLIKRDMAVKDSSELLLGHGGVLDRFDSLIIAPAAIYLYLFLIH